MLDLNFNNVENLNKFQKNLFGYQAEFTKLSLLLKKNKLPNKIIFNGNDGIGKSTYIFHLINLILSKKENHPYDINKFEISVNNQSFKEITNNVNFNFKHIKVDDEKKNISIEETRELINFLSHSSINKKPKICFLEGAEYLNKNSANSILKIIEELPENNYLFISTQNSHGLLDTIKSRCFVYRLFLKKSENLLVKNKLSLQFNITGPIYEHITPGSNIKLNILFNELNVQNLNFKNQIIEMQKFFIETKLNKVLELMNLYIENYFLSNMNYKKLFLDLNKRKKINKIIFNIKLLNNEPKSNLFEINQLLNI